jgi:ribosome-binding factor A
MKVNDEILKDAAEIIRGELADPRLGAMISVVRAETTADLLQTKIYVSVFDGNKNNEENQANKKEVMKVLKNSAGYIRKLLAERINLRNTPEVIFVLDESLDYSEKINNLIEEVKREDARRKESAAKS